MKVVLSAHPFCERTSYFAGNTRAGMKATVKAGTLAIAQKEQQVDNCFHSARRLGDRWVRRLTFLGSKEQGHSGTVLGTSIPDLNFYTILLSESQDGEANVRRRGALNKNETKDVGYRKQDTTSCTGDEL
jgi:hypothetical protein